MTRDANRALSTVRHEAVPVVRDELVALFLEAEGWTQVGTEAERAERLRESVGEILSEWLLEEIQRNGVSSAA